MRALFPLLALLIPLALHAESWTLEDPTPFDLRMSASLFDAVPLELPELHFDPEFAKQNLPEGVDAARELLARSRPKTCHSQGLAISDRYVFVSCSFYADTFKRIRAYAARSLLLRARKDEVFAPQGEVHWELVDLTQQHEDERFDPPVTRVLGHPSGLILDPEGADLWLATAVYDPRTYAFLQLLRWEDSEPLTFLRPPLQVEDHIGTVGLFLHGTVLMGIDWEARLYLVELATGRSKWLDPGFEVEYQDCDIWSERRIVCGGYQKGRLQEKGVEWQAETGRLDLLALEGESFETWRVTKVGRIAARGIDGNASPVFELGRQQWRYQEGRGDIDAHANRYGDYQTPLTLTNNGMAVSPDRKYVYFLPADLPQARLLRFALTEGAP